MIMNEKCVVSSKYIVNILKMINISPNKLRRYMEVPPDEANELLVTLCHMFAICLVQFVRLIRYAYLVIKKKELY